MEVSSFGALGKDGTVIDKYISGERRVRKILLDGTVRNYLLKEKRLGIGYDAWRV